MSIITTAMALLPPFITKMLVDEIIPNSDKKMLVTVVLSLLGAYFIQHAVGALRGYIFKDAAKNRVYVRSKPEPGAKEAVTYYTTLASANGLSLVECRLGTGRTHQIRAQMSAAGWPLLGDGKYGSDRENKKLGEDGQLLYSYRLEFAFKTDAGALNYLNGRSFSVAKVDFAEKYFPGIRF